ncbi:S8 family peptidase [Eisenibacter elegans]|jgi:thermitase|uniref:S8 family peptidase n=1 Tax=Eisenibacter elegans TaxID=997 RepID=UPI0004094664|nr:S8 family serine peptidase [Eisenibacter elegans]
MTALQTNYPYIFGALLLSVVWWFATIHRNPDSRTVWPSLLFWGSGILYALSLYFSTFSFWYKLLLMLPRDLGILAVVFLIANNIKNSRGFFVTAVSVALLILGIYSSIVQQAVAKVFKPNVDPQAELLFEADEAQLKLVKHHLRKYNVKIEKAFDSKKDKDANLDRFYTINIEDKDEHHIHTVSNLVYASGVSSVGQNRIVQLSPLDKASPIEGQRPGYGLNDPQLNLLWGFERMKMAEFYTYLRNNKIKPKRKARIAILDTGVDKNHEDINARYVSIKSAYDRDGNSHGTHCAGIAAAVSNNGKGIASFAPDDRFVEVTSVKVLSDQGSGTDKGVIAGIIEAADNKADVISMSLGGHSSEVKRRAFAQAVRYANKRGAIVVVAAGNESQDAIRVSPANVDGVIVVTAVDQQLNRARFSNWISSLKWGIAAPGVGIQSTIPGNKYAAYNGTSMATPYVAGLLGMMKALDPKLDTEKAYKILSGTGIDTQDTSKTGKFIQPLQALQALSKP